MSDHRTVREIFDDLSIARTAEALVRANVGDDLVWSSRAKLLKALDEGDA